MRTVDGHHSSGRASEGCGSSAYSGRNHPHRSAHEDHPLHLDGHKQSLIVHLLQQLVLGLNEREDLAYALNNSSRTNRVS